MIVAGGVDIRLVPFPSASGEVARLKGYLSELELQRGNRVLDPGRRERFFAGRGILRERLAEYLGEAPETVRLTEGPFGKPRLADGPNSDIRFNMSHAGNYLLLAVARGREVGCDLEDIRQELSYASMAERYFSPREREDLFALPPERQLVAFYRCWTRREAYLKGAGTGFSQPCTEFDVSLHPDHPPAILCHRGNPEEPRRWTLLDIDVPEGYCAALAVENVG